MGECFYSGTGTHEEGANMSINRTPKAGHKIQGIASKQVRIKSQKTDTGGTFDTFDIIGDSGILLAKNRYVYSNDGDKRPYAKLTPEEVLILNPPVVESEPDIMEK